MPNGGKFNRKRVAGLLPILKGPALYYPLLDVLFLPWKNE